MATAQLTASSISATSLGSFGGRRPSNAKFGSPSSVSLVGHISFHGLFVNAPTTVAPKILQYISIKPLGDLSSIKINIVEEKAAGATILFPITVQTCTQANDDGE